MKQIFYSQQGQTLVSLLFFIVIAIAVTTAASTIMLVNSLASSKEQDGIIALSIAESGGEDALLRLLRDPTFTGETLTINGGTAVVTVTGSGPYTITSTGTNGNYVRKIQITASYTNSVLTVTAWNEVF